MTTAIVVQARASSSRLPQKMYADLGGKPAVLRCLDRCARVADALVVAAVADEAESDGLQYLIEEAGYRVVRGSTTDVLARTAAAAHAVAAEIVVRVTSDCPLIDHRIVEQTIDLLYAENADYASNNMPASWPHGLDCEVMPAGLLYEADRKARAMDEREHVTPWIRRNLDLDRVTLAGPGGAFARLRWTLDYPEDLTFFRSLYTAMGERAATASAAEIAALCLRRPDLTGTNAHLVDEARLGAQWCPSKVTAPCSMPRAA
jgi:spore coat polysaccharide biosynthesis protein SpsF (cytidylyltransferase family)